MFVLVEHTTVSVTNGVGIQPRGGAAVNAGAEVVNDRGIVAGRRAETGLRWTARPSRWREVLGRMVGNVQMASWTDMCLAGEVYCKAQVGDRVRS